MKCFISTLLILSLLGCADKKAEQAAYSKGCQAAALELLEQAGLPPNLGAIKDFCDKAAQDMKSSAD